MNITIRQLGAAALALSLTVVPAIASADNDQPAAQYFRDPAPVATAPEVIYPQFQAFAQALNDADLDALDEAYRGQFPMPLPEESED